MINICIAGKNSIAVNVLEYLLKYYSSFNYVVCINKNDIGYQIGQDSLKEFAINNSIPILKLDELYQINNLFFFSLEFDQIIKPEKFISTNLFNIHFSLLPSYKGMYTSALPILFNEEYTGVTLHEIDKGIDTGDIIAQKKIKIDIEYTCEDLYLKYLEFGEKLFLKHFESLVNNEYGTNEQGVEKASYYSKKTIDYRKIIIDLNKTALEVHNQIRAFTFPLYQYPKVNNVEIYKSEIYKHKTTGKPGSIIIESEFYILLNCIDYQVKLYKNRREELYTYVKEGLVNKIHYFKENGYFLNQKSKEGWDILIVAGYNCNLELVQYLIEKLDWNVNTTNNKKTTFAMYVMSGAILFKKYEVLKYIIRNNKIDWQVKDIAGKCIFEYAKQYEDKIVLEVLKEVKND